MNIEDKVKTLNKEQGDNFRKDQDFVKMEEFYKQAIDSGLARKPEYSLPQIDTIGSIFYFQSIPHK